jgi:AraC-like DNA-binding protein
LGCFRRLAGVSVSYLSRTFRRVTGETFEHYVMRKRVELAQRFLLEPSNNIAAVADRCGFSDASYFARVFRKITGCSPREYCDNPLRLAGASAPESNQPFPIILRD